jgi:hypothetical protein
MLIDEVTKGASKQILDAVHRQRWDQNAPTHLDVTSSSQED